MPRRARHSIPVAILEFDEGGQCIWVHDAKGSTVLRIKVKNIKVQRGCENICAHSDMMVNNEVTICLPDKPAKAPSISETAQKGLELKVATLNRRSRG